MGWPWLPVIGAFCFGAVLGWNLFFVNRYRKGEISFGDLVTLVGAVAGAAVLGLFPAQSDLFGAYGVGLAVGFFAYFGFLWHFVGKSENFETDWFLDGRRKNPAEGHGYATDTRQTVAPMSLPPMSLPPVRRTELTAGNVTIAINGENPGEAARIDVGAQHRPLAVPEPEALSGVRDRATKQAGKVVG